MAEYEGFFDDSIDCGKCEFVDFSYADEPCNSCYRGNINATENKFQPKGINANDLIRWMRDIKRQLADLNGELENRIAEIHSLNEPKRADDTEVNKAADIVKTAMDNGANIFKTVEERAAFKAGAYFAITIMSCNLARPEGMV